MNEIEARKSEYARKKFSLATSKVAEIWQKIIELSGEDRLQKFAKL